MKQGREGVLANGLADAKRVGLDGYGLHIVERVPLPVRANAENIRYLKTKRDRMGHELSGLEDYDGVAGDAGGML